MKKIVNLDAKKLTDKIKSHTYLKEQFDFPDYYGNNLDALYDCLTELSEIEIFMENVDEAGDYYSAVISVIKEAAQDNYGLTIIMTEKE